MLNFNNINNSIWIGLDIGTTGVRAIAYQKNGVSLCSSDEFYPLETPYPDWAEQNPEIIYKAIEKVVRDTANTLIYKGKTVSGIAISLTGFSVIDPIVSLAIAAIMYFILTFISSRLIARLEKRMKHGRA